MGSRLRGNDGARQLLREAELACRARVIAERRRKHGFLFTAWVFLPDHGHAILLPRHPLTFSEGMESIKGARRCVSMPGGTNRVCWGSPGSLIVPCAR
jgi:hypothetical protein